MPTIAVLGPGGVGGFIAAALSRAREEVLVIAREQTAELIAGRGIEVQSVKLGNFSVNPAARATLTEPVDVLLVATKANGLEPSLERIQAQPVLIVPLLNGLDHMALLRSRFGHA